MNINPKEHDCDESICYLHLFFNTFAMNIQKKEGVDLSGSLQNCILELYDGKEDTYIVLNQLEPLFKNKFDTIVLWFGDDMFCQMNMLTILAYLEQSNFDEFYQKRKEILSKKLKDIL